MRFGICLHGGAVARSSMGLHPTDRRAILLGLAAGAEIVIVEAVGRPGSAPTAGLAALASGATRVLRVVDPALDAADAQTTSVVLATTFDGLDVDLILFGDDADPEGIGDVAACVAHNMSAIYLAGVVDLKTPEGELLQPAIEATVNAGSRLCSFRLPLNAVVGIAAGGTPGEPVPVAVHTAARTIPGPTQPGQGPIEISSLDDLKLDPALVRRRHDGRGTTEAASRPLVTSQSAASIAALLRR